MPRPVIGLSCYLEPAQWGAWEIEAALLPHWYIDLFQEAGARVVMLPPDTGDDVDVLDRIDGLVIVGGADVNPASYGESPHETSDVPRTSRDTSEANLYRGARERQMPVLGICRGLQVMAVVHGGALHQNLPDVSALVHRERPGQFVNHAATFTAGSMIANSLGATDVIVNSSHHQAVRDPGDLTVTGWAQDGTIEVCEDQSMPFCVGVQWHPEHPDRRVADLGLISRFIDAAGKHGAGGHE